LLTKKQITNFVTKQNSKNQNMAFLQEAERLRVHADDWSTLMPYRTAFLSLSHTHTHTHAVSHTIFIIHTLSLSLSLSMKYTHTSISL